MRLYLNELRDDWKFQPPTVSLSRALSSSSRFATLYCGKASKIASLPRLSDGEMRRFISIIDEKEATSAFGKPHYSLLTRSLSLSPPRHQASKLGKENEPRSCEQKEPSEGKSRDETALREIFPEDESKYTSAILGREAERGRSKFEELQAASKNLERRLHEDDDYRRRQEIERRMNKDKPARYLAQFPVQLPIFR